MTSTRIFVACGTRDIDSATDLASSLGEALPGSSVDVWNKPGVFELSDSLFNQLLDTADAVDFAVVLLPDEGVAGATDGAPAVSPNVMFELGLFYGRLERYRTIIVSRGQELPADLHGVLVVPVGGREGDTAATLIAAHVRKFGPRVVPAVELGSLERMLNVCTPDHADHRTPHLLQVRSSSEERFNTAGDFHDLARALLEHYVIASMGPEQANHVRAYLAVYIGDGVLVSLGGDVCRIRRTQVGADRDGADETFLIALSNPWGGALDTSAVPELLQVRWRIARGIPGFEDDDPQRPRSNVARVFGEQVERSAAAGDRHNRRVDDEAEVFATPVLWREADHTASIAVLGLSMDTVGATLDNQDLLGRLRLVGNVLGVAAGRLARALQLPSDAHVGVRTEPPSDQRSFAFRAVTLRRAIGGHVVEELLHSRDLETRQVESDRGTEHVLVRPAARGRAGQSPPSHEPGSTSPDS